MKERVEIPTLTTRVSVYIVVAGNSVFNLIRRDWC